MDANGPRPPAGGGGGTSYPASLNYSVPLAMSSTANRPLDLTQSVSSRAVPMMLGASSLGAPFTPQFHVGQHQVVSPMSPMHLVTPAHPYMQQIPSLSSMRDAIGKGACSQLTPSALSYFQQVGSNLSPGIIGRGPQLTPSAFLAGAHHGAHGSVSCALPTPDAMGYLEQVKNQFGSSSSTYNEFLEVMKDFKDQTLDIIGVIKRIGALFLNSPNLINGFNTFLPPGYRLEAGSDRTERIVVYSPSCQMHVFSEEELVKELQSSVMCHIEPSNVYRRTANGQVRDQALMPPESTSAINYVNKIKVRFQSTPHVYQEFLEILQSYQREQQERTNATGAHCTMADARVFNRVAKLFANDKDLLEEFSQFLPDAPLMHLRQMSPAAADGGGAGPSGSAGDGDGPCSSGTGTAVVAAAAPQEPKGQTKGSAAAATSDSAGQIALRSRAQKSKGSAVQAGAPLRKRTRLSTSAEQGGSGGGSRGKAAGGQPATTSDTASSDGAVPSTSSGGGQQLTCLEDCMFLEKLRYAFKEERVYMAFLTTLKLFNLNFLSRADIAQVLHMFLKDVNKDLTDWVMNVVSPSASGEQRPASRNAQANEPFEDPMTIDFSSCEQHGRSYRSIPESYRQPKSSGRTALGESVLNFKYLSFPTWHSEDNATLTIKRSIYEEHLFVIEEERCEADMIIELNRTLMDGMAGILAELQNISVDTEYTTNETLNTGSKTQAITGLRRVYTRYWETFYEAAMKSPRNSLKMMLNTLKDKQREWVIGVMRLNATWRQSIEDAYWKALEQRAVNFRQQDLKTVRTRALVNVLESAYKERQELAEKRNQPVEEGPHLSITYPAGDVAFYDVGDLVLHYVRRQSSINPACKRRIKRLVKVLLPTLLGLEAEDLSDLEDDNDCSSRGGRPAKANHWNSLADVVGKPPRNNGNGSRGGGAGGRGRSKRRRGNARYQAAGKGRGQSASNNEANEESAPERPSEDLNILSDVKRIRPMPMYTVMFVPNTWYVFLRLHHRLNERLNTFYKLSHDLVAMKGETNSEYLFQTTVLRHRFACGTVQPQHLYGQLINLIKHLLDNEIDMATYEEAVRDVYTLNAHLAFTFMKMIQIMSRQLQVIVNDVEPTRAFRLFEKWSSRIFWCSDVEARAKLEAGYQAEAEALLANQNCIKIRFLPNPEKCITFELVDVDGSDEERTTSTSVHNAGQDKAQEGSALWESIQPSDGIQIFLRRNVITAYDHMVNAANETNGENVDEGGAGGGSENGDSLRPMAESQQASDQLLAQYWQRCAGDEAAPGGNRLQVRVKKSYWIGEASESMNDVESSERFYDFLETWALKHTSVEKHREVNTMLMGDRKDAKLAATWMRRVEEPCPTRPPFLSINRYVKYESEEGRTIFSKCRQ